jgi:hypothetical protein
VEVALSSLKSGEVIGVHPLGDAPANLILCHELCRELGVKSTICLPMPPDEYANRIFRDLDTWRSRYLELARHRRPALASNARAGTEGVSSSRAPAARGASTDCARSDRSC